MKNIINIQKVIFKNRRKTNITRNQNKKNMKKTVDIKQMLRMNQYAKFHNFENNENEI